MIKSLQVINYVGRSLTINLPEMYPSHGLYLSSIEGLNPPEASIHRTELATSDGSVFNSSRLESRNIVIKFILGYAKTIEDTRQRLYQYFPVKRPITLIITSDNRKVRAEGYVESNEINIFSKEETAQISIICPDPYLYAVGDFGVDFTTFYGAVPFFEFVYSNESVTEPLTVFGEMEDMTENTIYYEGDAEAGMVLTIHARGPAKNITIVNTVSREKMIINTDIVEMIAGGPIKIGDSIKISTVRGKKGIELLRDGVRYNIINSLDRDSDWFMLHQGDNIFSYYAEEGTKYLQFLIENAIIYEGI